MEVCTRWRRENGARQGTGHLSVPATLGLVAVLFFVLIFPVGALAQDGASALCCEPVKTEDSDKGESGPEASLSKAASGENGAVPVLVPLGDLQAAAGDPAYVVGTHVSSLDNLDDAYAGSLPIGFDFPFYGSTRDGFYVTTNGVISFGGGDRRWTNMSLPSSEYNYPAIFPFWDDLHPSPSQANLDGFILYQTVGAGEHGNPYGQPVLIVQWTNYGYFASPLSHGTFQAHLVADGRIVFNYNQLLEASRAYGQRATIGVQEDGNARYLEYSYNTDAGIRSGLSLVLEPNHTGGYDVTGPAAGSFWNVLLTKAGEFPPASPRNPTPADQGESSLAPTLRWSGGERADDYQVVVSTQSNLSSPILNTTVTQRETSLSGLSPGTLYYWQVIARNASGQAPSDLWRFTAASVETYRVLYEDNGAHSGAVPTDLTEYSEGEPATVAGNTGGLSRTGYDFGGWNTQPDGSGTQYAPGGVLVMQDRDAILYAVWTPASYTLTFDSAGGSAVPAVTQPYGSAVSAPAEPVRQGHTFAGWSPAVPGTMPAEDRTLTAQWDRNSYGLIIEYEMSDGTPAPAPYSGSVLYESAYAVSSPSVTGYTPDLAEVSGTMPAGPVSVQVMYHPNPDTGYRVDHYTENLDGSWHLEETDPGAGTTNTATAAVGREFAGFTRQGFSQETIAPDGSTVVEIFYVRNEYTLGFDSAGGSAVPAVTQPYGSAVSAPAEPVRQGHTFAGWSPAVPGTMPAGDRTLTAQWDRNSYGLIIEYEMSDGTPAPAPYSGSVLYESAYAVSSPSVTGYTPDLAEVSGTMPAGPVSVQVMYHPNPDTGYRVDHYTENLDGSWHLEETDPGAGTTNTATAAVGREFAGFTRQGFSQETIAPDGSTVVEIFYVRNEYTLEFSPNGGTPVDPQTVLFGATAEAPPNPRRYNHSFRGWYTDWGWSDRWDFETDVVERDTTLYARWSRNPSPEPPEDPEDGDGNGAWLVVGGEKTAARMETGSEQDGRSFAKLWTDPESFLAQIGDIPDDPEARDGNSVEFSVPDTGSDIGALVLDGEAVKRLGEKALTVSLNWGSVRYNVSAADLAVADLAQQLGIGPDSLGSLDVEIRVSQPDAAVQELYESMVAQNEGELLIPPMTFEIVAKATDEDGVQREVSVGEFSNYVERVFAIPEGVDPEKVTTGVVFNPDGTYEHIPTEVFFLDGVWYARLNSMSNSDYSVIWNPVEVASVAGHWAEETVRDLASRLILVRPEEFVPGDTIGRADFAELMVRGLGLYRSGTPSADPFRDVLATDRNACSIQIASRYGIVSGYPDGTFRPDATISRQEAMVMHANAMEVIGMEDGDPERIEGFADRDEISPWAFRYAQRAVGAGVFTGRTGEILDPKGTITFAEAATAVRNLLVTARLINP